MDKHNPCFQEYVQNICFSISVLAFSSEALPKDLVAEIKQCPGRIMEEVTGFLTNQYRGSLHNYIEISSTYYPILYKLYQLFISHPVSSVSIGRPFSVQTSFFTPSHNRLMLSHMRVMLSIPMNHNWWIKNGWEMGPLDSMNTARFLGLDSPCIVLDRNSQPQLFVVMREQRCNKQFIHITATEDTNTTPLLRLVK